MSEGWGRIFPSFVADGTGTWGSSLYSVGSIWGRPETPSLAGFAEVGWGMTASSIPVVVLVVLVQMGVHRGATAAAVVSPGSHFDKTPMQVPWTTPAVDRGWAGPLPPIADPAEGSNLNGNESHSHRQPAAVAVAGCCP